MGVDDPFTRLITNHSLRNVDQRPYFSLANFRRFGVTPKTLLTLAFRRVAGLPLHGILADTSRALVE